MIFFNVYIINIQNFSEIFGLRFRLDISYLLWWRDNFGLAKKFNNKLTLMI